MNRYISQSCIQLLVIKKAKLTSERICSIFRGMAGPSNPAISRTFSGEEKDKEVRKDNSTAKETKAQLGMRQPRSQASSAISDVTRLPR